MGQMGGWGVGVAVGGPYLVSHLPYLVSHLSILYPISPIWYPIPYLVSHPNNKSPKWNSSLLDFYGVSPDTYCSDVSYFSMIFAAGLGVGLFYFGVGETVEHYAPGEDGEDRNRISYR